MINNYKDSSDENIKILTKIKRNNNFSHSNGRRNENDDEKGTNVPRYNIRFQNEYIQLINYKNLMNVVRDKRKR